MLNVIDEFTHECLAIRVARKLKAIDVIDVLSDLSILRGVPGHIRSDNGPEFIAKAVQEWISAVGAKTAYIAPGSPGTLPEARDNQSRLLWRGMISDLAQREDELTGKTLVIIGLGRIGGRLAGLAKAFGMEVIGVRRDPAAGANGADSVHRLDRLSELLPRADFVALTCPLTPETQGIIGADALSRKEL